MREEGILEKQSRTVVPRWRPFAEAARVDPALTSIARPGAPAAGADQERTDRDYLSDLRQFRRSRSEWFAGDLLVTAISRDDVATANEVASFLDNEAAASPTLKRIAQDYLAPGPLAAAPELGEARQTVRALRAVMRAYPRNGIAWADLAYYYNLNGNVAGADRAMRTAIQLSPDNRFVLRSASRFYIHRGEYEKAHDLLRRSDAIGVDPWLLAAEIAAATAAKKRSSLIKQGRVMVKDGAFHPGHVSELASAIATADLKDKHTPRRQVRSMFDMALKRPTENSLAQAGWASRVASDVAERPVLEGLHGAYEARAWELFVAGKFQEAIAFAEQWFADQPFSVRPPMLLSWILSAVFDEYGRSVDVLTRALRPNQNSAEILNNLAFAHANRDEVEVARGYIDRARSHADNDYQRLFIDATRGLIAYRENRPAEGLQLYLGVIERAQRTQADPRIESMAWSYIAREEIRANTMFAPAAIERAIDCGSRAKSPDAVILLKHLRPSFASYLAKN